MVLFISIFVSSTFICDARKPVVSLSTCNSHEIYQLGLSSDDLSTMRQPLLLLQLDVQQGDGTSARKTLEMTKEELDDVIASLQRAQQVVSLVNNANTNDLFLGVHAPGTRVIILAILASFLFLFVRHLTRSHRIPAQQWIKSCSDLF